MNFKSILQAVLFGAILPAALERLPAQTWQPAATPGTNWETVAVSADGSKLFAGSGYWNFCVSTNYGNTWATNTEPQANSGYDGWTTLAASANGTILAATFVNLIWVSTNSGVTWVSNTVAAANFFQSLALSADGTKMVIADGGYPEIYISTNSGLTVTPTVTPANIDYWASVATSAAGTQWYAAGQNGEAGFGGVYTSTNLGHAWTPTGAPTNNEWTAIAASADGSKLIAGSDTIYNSEFNSGGVFTSTNFGSTWVTDNVPAAQWQAVASSADGTRLVAVSVAPAGWIYTSTNSGASWVSNNVPNGGWSAVASSADGGTLLAATYPTIEDPVYTLRTINPPNLSLTLPSTNLSLSWIIPSTNYIVQQSSNLLSWVNLTNQPGFNFTNLRNQITLAATNSKGFYRLRTP